jgi:anionic cell wall polymer biosynthesis LytR-Cps2A-Psr (LCP) family protein
MSDSEVPGGEPAVPIEPLPVEPVPDPAVLPVTEDVTAEDVTAEAALDAEPVPVTGGVVGPVPVRVPVAPETSRAARRRIAEEEAAEEAATSRHRLLIVSGVVFGLIAAVFLVWAVFGRPRDNYEPVPVPSPSATGPVQPTLLFQIQDKDGIAVDTALLSVGGSVKRANVITIPPNVLVDVATGGTLPFGQIARLPDANGSANALSDAIGVDVDGTLAMNTLAFSGLVDAVGGVTADVDVDVVETKPDGTKVVIVPAGKAQVLQGPQAAAFATYLAPGEPEEARMARFTQVLRLTVAKLPSDVSKVEAIISGLGASARSTLPTSVVAAFLVRLQADVLVDNAAYKNLPVTPINGGAVASQVDQEAAAAMVQELLPDAARTPGPNSKVRVLVQNGVGTPGLNASARQLIVDAGFTFVNGANAPSLGHATTQIVVPDSGTTSTQWGADIAKALGVPASDVVIDSSGQTVADVIVVLGADFTPPKS